ncbi:MAG: oligosaccharide flippase family protein [Pseudomonadota bacterium]
MLRKLTTRLTPNEHNREVLRNTMLALALRAIGALLAFALNAVIARLLGASGAGIYFLALSITTIAALIARQGLDNALLRFIAAAAAKEEWTKARSIFAKGAKIVLLSSACLALLVVIGADIFAVYVFDLPELAQPLRFMSVAIMGAAMMFTLSESLKALNKVASSVIVVTVIFPLVALLCLWPLTSLYGPAGAAASYAIGVICAGALGFGLWLWFMRERRGGEGGAVPTGELFASSRPLWVMALVNRGVIPWTPLLFLGVWATPEETGIFGAATRIALLLSFFILAVNAAVAPKIGQLHAHGKHEAMQNLYRFTIAGLLPATACLFVLLLLAGDKVLILFGQEFVEGKTALIILGAGQMVQAVMGSVGHLLIMTGHEREVRTATLAGAATVIGFSALLIPFYGMVGAAIASALALSVSNIAAYGFVRSRLKFTGFKYF